MGFDAILVSGLVEVIKTLGLVPVLVLALVWSRVDKRISLLCAKIGALEKMLEKIT